MPIRCEIVSQDRIVYQGDADMVTVPGGDGVMGILPNHTPLLSTLQYGVITVKLKSEEFHFTAAGGIVEVQPDQVTILADAAENVTELDVNRAEAARQHAEELLKKGIPQDTDNYLALQAALRRSNLRLNAIKRYRSGHRSS
jgi:F-type H+-transporting ATPase subunit epsilon